LKPLDIYTYITRIIKKKRDIVCTTQNRHPYIYDNLWSHGVILTFSLCMHPRSIQKF